ncbi:MAG: tetratricopeptide repeat protein, partial [Proteobacteria bacterium]|nr:tetratricopeptide repeat protein [Pseudomonadota bacterium]
LSEIYFGERDLEMAQKQCEDILMALPNYYQARMILGNTFMYQGKIKEAQEAFESLIKIAPENPAGYFRLGLLQRLLGKYDLALANFDKAMTINNKLVDVFTNIILVHVAKKEFDTAINKCEKQIEIVKDHPALIAVVHNLKGGLYLAQNKKQEAEEAYKKALEENPNFLQPYYSLARIYLMDKKEDMAIAQFKAVLEKNPKHTQSHMILGTIYDMQKKFDISEKHYRTALEINPDFAPAANNLAYLIAERHDNLDEALGLAQKAKEKLPDSPGVMDTLGLIYFKKGLYDIAIQEFTDSLEKIPDNAIVHYHLGQAYYKKGDKELARVELEKALSLDDDFDGSEEARKILGEVEGRR